MSNYAIGLDVHDMSAPVSLNVKQGESGQIINISLRSGGKPYLLPSGAYAVFAGKKPDGKILWNSCKIVDQTIQYEITKQTTAVVGWLPVQIRLYSAGGKLLLTPDFVLIVDAPVAGDEEVIAVSENEITALTELVSEVTEAIEHAKNVEGKSAYEVAVEEGFEGSVSEWLLSLIGKDGASTTISLQYGVSSHPGETSLTGWQDTIPAMSEAFPYLWIKIYTETKTVTGGSASIEKGIIGYYSPEATPLTVTISGTAASHSASEIIAAIKAEKIVEVNMGTERLQVTAWDESAVTVSCEKAPSLNGIGSLLLCQVYTIADDKTVTIETRKAITTNFTATSGQVVAVDVWSPNGPNSFKGIDVREEFIATYGTTTFAEIWRAMSAGKAVYCKNGNVTLPMTACIAQSFTAEFGGVTESGSVVWKVKSATWSSYNAALDLTVQNGRLYLTVNGTVTGGGVDASTLSALIE